jgi:hypothetical protein
LIYHPEKTAVDLRLLSQIELNFIRADANTSILESWDLTTGDDINAKLASTVQDYRLKLDLWLAEWTGIIQTNGPIYSTAKEHSLALVHLKVQHAWALTTLHLKAISSTGIENIAAMVDTQREIVVTAKEAAIHHLRCILDASPTASPSHDHPSPDSVLQANRNSNYLATFRWAMDFMWAKCAFSVLLVLRLAVLLRDPPNHMLQLLRDAQNVLTQLENAAPGQVSYIQIVRSSVEKCGTALREQMTQHSYHVGAETGLNTSRATDRPANQGTESEFECYAPKEFLSEWNFPGLNLRHVPLSWQDLFFDLGGGS